MCLGEETFLQSFKAQHVLGIIRSFIYESCFFVKQRKIKSLEAVLQLLLFWIIDHYTLLGNCPPTPPLSQHFALSDLREG